MPIAKINLFEEAKAITQPFLVVDLADIDDFVARLFISEGMVAWHKHIDEEQLFLVLDGELTLESEWGNNTLRSGEMAVVPKAVTHRCGSTIRTIALVFERKFFANRQNGQRRLFALRGGGKIKPVNIGAEAVRLTQASASQRLIGVDDLGFSLVHYGAKPRDHESSAGSELLLVQQGILSLDTEVGAATLERAEMTVVPRGIKYRGTAPDRAVVLRVSKMMPGP
jgi:homogentisate 1,2-dioxygenase